MNNLDYLYSDLKKLNNYNDSSKEAKNYLLSAYNCLENVCDLSECFLVDGMVADNGQLSKERKNLLSIYNEANSEVKEVTNLIADKQRTIRNEEYKVETEKQKAKEKAEAEKREQEALENEKRKKAEAKINETAKLPKKPGMVNGLGYRREAM